MGNVSFGGIQKRICLEWVPDVRVGDYVIVHVGFAIGIVDEKEATETLELLRQMEAGLDKPAVTGSDQDHERGRNAVHR
jgi:hydrogenase expression/formation protein HypC